MELWKQGQVGYYSSYSARSPSALSQFKIISPLPSQEYNSTKFEESNNSLYLFVCSSVTA